MICEDMKLLAFEEVAKMFDSQIDGQKLPIEGAVPGLVRL